MSTTPLHKECLTCHKPVRGRSDKKFCNDYCRNVFNNNLKEPAASVVRQINTALLKNRRILLALLNQKQTIKVKKEQLMEFGFRFHYFTHRFRNHRGGHYSFCYDAGYLNLEDDWILLVKQDGTRVPIPADPTLVQ